LWKIYLKLKVIVNINMHSQIKKVVEALELLPIEWRVVPTFGKRPLGNSWQKINYSPKELRNKLILNQMKINLKYKIVVPTGVAVVCGEYSAGHLIAIDCDGPLGWNKILEFAGFQVISDTPAQVREQALQYLPSTVALTSGKEFRAQFLYFIPKATLIKSVKLEHLELRGGNLASVLPPSFHPEGRKYRWLTGCSPQERNVAIAPAWVIKHMHNQYKCS
jgi:Bifunctional DNA primase/polymerase, N-terminal